MKRKKQPTATNIEKATKLKRINRAGVTLSSISSKVYFLIVIMTAFISATLYYYIIMLPEQERSERYLNLVFSNYAELAESSVVAVSKRLEVIARSPNVIDSFSISNSSDPVTIKALEANLTIILPKAIGIRLVPVGTFDIDMESIPPISNVTLELLRNSGRGRKQAPEVVRVGQPDQYIAMVENVVTKKGELLGYVLAGIDISIISDGLQNIRSIPGYIEFRQEYSGTVHVLGRVGDDSLKQGEPLNISRLDDSLWQMAYWSHPDEDFSAGKEQLLFVLGLTSIFLLISVLGYLGYKKINDTLSNDASTLMRLILENPDGSIEVPSKGFTLRIFYDMAYTLQRVTNDLIAKKGPQAPQKKEDVQKQKDKNEFTSSPPDIIPDLIDTPSKTKQAAIEQLNGIEEDEEDEEDEGVEETHSPISPSIFRAYDIRGIVGETLTVDTVRWIGQSIGTEAFERGEQTIIVARDGRKSGEELLVALKEGLLASGRDVIDIGMVPTPLLYFATHYLQSRSGVMLTGSHNPSNYNGLKIVLAGDSLYGDDITEIYNRIQRRDLLNGEGTESSNDI
ncbi:MAG: hypothetical protein GY808_13565, partial [Gammaproteobacteria bacterium]|nr:hypothetical protein [Gammaproteobacteria bacterium]